MAKTRSQSKHSRAARRAVSPSADVDKSLTSLPRAESTVVQRESILSERANAGVTKKQPKPKAKSRVQRARQQKGIDRAELVLDQLEKKVEKSVTRGKTVKERRVGWKLFAGFMWDVVNTSHIQAEWEDLNRKSGSTMFQALNDEAEDNNDDDAMVDASAAPQKSKQQPQPTFAVQNPVTDDHADIDVDDDIT
ncbi:Alb1-domain-containing protein [Aspergillus avenaceus]|uniref:Alb1-domain-containing protein n=1 Tax=Aspergillus avenaceus TaxID=36643 RepID=A0A5N6U8R5_ASPAV|nr:Alb1-domain-containing protein [Aspergillus avenaceus]